MWQSLTTGQASFIHYRCSGTLLTDKSIRCSNVMMKTLMLTLFLFLSAGCNPTVKLEAPKEPIEINLNVKIEHNIRVQVDEELEDLFDEESDIF